MVTPSNSIAPPTLGKEPARALVTSGAVSSSSERVKRHLHRLETGIQTHEP
jgi:hypothetical protein